MDFRLDDGQLELQQTVARFCADRFGLDDLGSREGQSLDRTGWRAMAELGVFGLLLDEERGGSGLAAVDGAIVFEQLGSHLAPGPVLWTVLVAPLVDGAATGEAVVGGVEARWITDGTAVVEHAPDIDVLLVVDPDGIVAHRPAELGGPDAMTPLDPLTPVGRFTGIAAGAGAAVAGAAVSAERQLLGTVLSAALLVGLASRALEVARVYALEREQFGAPIGSFQAIKHLLADMYVTSGLAQSATYAAAAVLDDTSGPTAARAASTAKLLAAEAAIANAGTAIQILGGMGFTWAMVPHYLLKRAWSLEQGFGPADEHAAHLGTTFAGALA